MQPVAEPPDDEDDEDDFPRRASVVVKTLTDGSDGEVPMQLVVDANGDKAVVQVFFEHPDDSQYAAAVERAERAAAAAEQGALRSSLRIGGAIDLTTLSTQKKVLKLSLQPSASEPANGEKLLRLRIAPT